MGWPIVVVIIIIIAHKDINGHYVTCDTWMLKSPTSMMMMNNKKKNILILSGSCAWIK